MMRHVGIGEGRYTGERGRARRLAVGLAVVTALTAALEGQPGDLHQLLRTHHWFELRSLVTERSPSLIRASVATAFNDPETAERLLHDIIMSAPSSSVADDAYEMLARIYLRSGQYGRWQTLHRQWMAALPESKRARAEEDTAKRFAGRPDQVNGRPRRALLRHDPGEFTMPASVDGTLDDYVFDTGAWHSVMTERRATRLGLKIDATRRVLSGASGQKAGFRTAIAKEVEIGGTRFSNVSFAVLDDTGPLATVDAGIIGMPILLGLETIRWTPGGVVEVGEPPSRLGANANLVFDRDRLLLRASVLGRDVLTTLDTGAVTTDLNANFADMFPQALLDAKKGKADITGVGGTQTFESLEVPEVIFRIGPVSVSLRPATVSLQRVGPIGGDCCVGNAGEDLLTQTGFTLDLSAMTLQLNSAPD